MTSNAVLGTPRLRLDLEGETGRRLEAIIRNWLLTVPDVNPGILEMMRLRDRTLPYENPVPWAGEFIGKYLTSAVLARRMSDSSELDALLRQVIAELIATQAEDGYLGPFKKEERLLGHWDLWGHYHTMLALYLWYHDTGDRAALEAALRAADLICATYLDTGRRIHDAGSQEMNMAVIHILGILYRETGNEAYFRLMKEIEQNWEKPPAGDYFRKALEGIEFYQIPKPRWESLHPMLGLGELYRITGDARYKEALLHWWHSIRRTDVHNSGSFSTSEQAVGNPFKPGAIETCCTVAWMAYSVEALRLSGDSAIADALELATWNAVLAHQHPSGRWCTYDTPMNGKRLASAHAIVFQARPGTPELNCCSVNGPRGLTMLSEWAVLVDTKGLFLNYYGPGTIEATLEDGSTWTFIQKTAYPADGAVSIEVQPGAAGPFPVHLRIPAWSENTAVTVNGAPAEGVEAGTYLTLERPWQAGDRIEIDFDMRLRALRGDHFVDFNTSLYKGPLLLAYDQKCNTVEPGDVPALDLENLELAPASCDARFQPMVLFKATAVDGQELYLADFATAGAHGTTYRSWLPVLHAPPVPFQLLHPEQNARLPVEEVCFFWSSAGPDARYTLTVAESPDLRDAVVRRSALTETEHVLDAAFEPGKTYFWQVTAEAPEGGAPSATGPWGFQLDPAVQTSLKGVVLRARLAGAAEADEGKLLQETGTAPAADRHGNENGAIHFDGETSKLVYEAPHFPLRNYTFAAWFCPESMTTEDRGRRHIFSAWCKGSDDPLRVSAVAKKLVVNIEQATGVHHISGMPIENGEWLHVAVVKDFNELRLYVNGEKKRSIAVPVLLQSGAKNLGIGCNPNFGNIEGFRGAIAEVLLSREALDEAQIQELYRQPDAPAS